MAEGSKKMDEEGWEGMTVEFIEPHPRDANGNKIIKDDSKNIKYICSIYALYSCDPENHIFLYLRQANFWSFNFLTKIYLNII